MRKLGGLLCLVLLRGRGWGTNQYGTPRARRLKVKLERLFHFPARKAILLRSGYAGCVLSMERPWIPVGAIRARTRHESQ
jgi:hypothetical protein